MAEDEKVMDCAKCEVRIRRQERERITNWGLEYCYDKKHIVLEGSIRQRRKCSKCWQALKEE